MFDNSVTPAQQLSQNIMFSPEFFFWSPDSPQIVIKQAHVIKRWLGHADRSTADLTTRNTGLANKKIDGTQYWITPEALHQLIYPGWEPIPYQMKNPSPIFSQRESWFRQMTDLDPAFRHYRISIEKKWSITPDYWKNDPADVARGFKQSFSRDYDVGF
jgi:hypothetical protein